MTTEELRGCLYGPGGSPDYATAEALIAVVERMSILIEKIDTIQKNGFNVNVIIEGRND